MSRLDSSTSLSGSYSSFSGVDIKVVINGVQCGNMQQVSYMIQREKMPNYVMGSVDPISFGRGKRAINGVIRGLLLDLDLLYSESFKNEKALLDKDEVFFKEINSTEKVEKKPAVRQRLKRRKPPETRSRMKYIYDVFFSYKVFPGGSLGDAAETCIESIIVSALEAAGAALASGGLGGVPAAVAFVEASIVACVGGIARELIFEDGITHLLAELTKIPFYSNKYDEHLKEIEEWNKKVDAENAKIKLTEAGSTATPASPSVEEYGYIQPQEYDLENLGSNYIINKTEYLDQILPFDIVIIAVNEYGQSAQMRLYGCEIVSANSEFSIDSMTVPFSLNFVARTILPWRSFDLMGAKPAELASAQNPNQVPVTRSAPPQTPISPAGTSQRELTEEEIEAADDLLFGDDLAEGNDGIEEPLDSDRDGVPDEFDELPFDPNESSDNDGDGFGDNSDSDSDNDGIPNEIDPEPTVQNDPVEILGDDLTGGNDGIEEPLDSDGDGIPDEFDLDPENADIGEPTTEDMSKFIKDTDGDSIANSSDPDNDNDGILDTEDPEPNIENDPANLGDDLTGGDDNPGFYGPDSDIDGDGIPDYDDDDADGDGTPDAVDLDPVDPNIQ